MTQGWECPKCKTCYAPWKDQCECNIKIAQLPFEKSDQEGKLQQQQSSCFICKLNHYGMPCPSMTVTSSMCPHCHYVHSQNIGCMIK